MAHTKSRLKVRQSGGRGEADTANAFSPAQGAACRRHTLSRDLRQLLDAKCGALSCLLCESPSSRGNGVACFCLSCVVVVG
jgi:hypothetical protein